MNRNYKNPPGARAVRGCAARASNFATSQNNDSLKCVQTARHASTMKQICDGSTGGDNFGRARGCVVVEVKNFLRRVSSGDVLSNSSENNGLSHVIPWTKLRVEHIATQTQIIRRSDRNPDPPNTSRKYFPVMRLCLAGVAVVVSTIPRHVARVFPACFGVGVH